MAAFMTEADILKYAGPEPEYDPYEGDAVSFGGKALGVAGDTGFAAMPFTGPAAPYVAAASGLAKLGSLGIDYFYDEPKTRAAEDRFTGESKAWNERFDVAREKYYKDQAAKEAMNRLIRAYS